MCYNCTLFVCLFVEISKRQKYDDSWKRDVVPTSDPTPNRSVFDDSWKYQVVAEANPAKPFADKGTKRKYQVLNDMRSEFLALCRKHYMTDVQDVLHFLKYVEAYITDDKNRMVASTIEDQLKTLRLPDRNHLIRLLTHVDDRLNHDMLCLFPSLQARSTLLLGITERKVREDKIDVEFISEFMHNYCRYAYLMFVVVANKTFA